MNYARMFSLMAQKNVELTATNAKGHPVYGEFANGWIAYNWAEERNLTGVIISSVN